MDKRQKMSSKYKKIDKIIKNSRNDHGARLRNKESVLRSSFREACDSSCFVATSVYGNTNHPSVIFLREFRESCLCKFKIGKLFVVSYYVCGPVLARYVSSHPILKKVLRYVLSVIVAILRFFIKMPEK